MMPARSKRPLPLVSIVPLVDVLLILLVFFLVTSTFLNLDMLPLIDSSEAAPEPGSSAQTGSGAILLRILPDGSVATAGVQVSADRIDSLLQAQRDAKPGAPLLVLPSPQASVQGLVHVLDAAAALGIGDVKVVRFGGAG